MTTDLALYIAQSGAWAIGGFLGGFVTGRTVRDVHTIATQNTSGATSMPMPRPKRFRFEWVIGIVVMLLAIATVGQGWVEGAADRTLLQCQQNYANGVAAALDARTDASAAAQNALDTLVTTIGQAISTPPTAATHGAVEKAITTYLVTRTQLKAQQAAHPYPPAPSTACPER